MGGTLVCIGSGLLLIIMISFPLLSVLGIIKDEWRRLEFSAWVKYILLIIIFLFIILATIICVTFITIGYNSVEFDIIASDNTVYRAKFYFRVVNTDPSLSLVESLTIRSKISNDKDYGYNQRVERFFENTFNNLLPYKPTVEDIKRICNTLDGSLLDLPNITFKLNLEGIKFVEAF